MGGLLGEVNIVHESIHLGGHARIQHEVRKAGYRDGRQNGNNGHSEPAVPAA